MMSAPGCWALYSEVLGREYSDQAYFAVHQLTVDAYAVQHPGGDNRQARQSVALHLTTLYAYFEHNQDGIELVNIRRQLSSQESFPLLTPPDSHPLTVIDVHTATNAQQHIAVVRLWAESVWHAWGHQRKRVQAWHQQAVA